MNEIIPFEFEKHSVRVVTGEDGNPWFVAKDVCDVLDVVNSRRATDRLSRKETNVRVVNT